MKGRSGGGKPSGRGGAPKASRGPQKSNRGPSQGPRGARAPERAAAPRGGPRRDSTREFRPNSKDRWVIGIHSVEESLRVRPRAARELWLRDDYMSSQQLREIAESAQKSRVEIKTKTQGQLDQLGSGHQGVAIAMTEGPVLDWKKLEEPGHKIIIALDNIEDPHNLGSILRTSWLTGVSGILIPEDRSVGLTPAACKVASGGAEHVAVEAHSNLPSALQMLKDIGFWIYGLSEKGKSSPWQFSLPEKVVWVVGSEGSGMRIPTERACDELVRIPQVSTGSSYNAAIAAAIALAETCRQFGKPE